MNTCQEFYSSMRAVVSADTRKAFKHAAVLGGGLGYTVELADGTQIEVGRTCCKYCARTEALVKLSGQTDLE